MLFIYLVAVNLVALLMFGVDKLKARHSFWRIPEKTLILSALLGGSIGALAGMYIFRHKTQHKLFTIGLPLILLLQLLFILWVASGDINIVLLPE